MPITRARATIARAGTATIAGHADHGPSGVAPHLPAATQAADRDRDRARIDRRETAHVGNDRAARAGGATIAARMIAHHARRPSRLPPR